MKSSSKLGFHEGSTLMRTANTYPTILEVVLEAVQNALDKNAKRVHISVNQKSRTLSVRDDGDGVDMPEFDKALSRVGRTLKKSDKIGRFGIGMVSPVGKCERYTFTSTPRGNDRGYKEWRFDTEVLRTLEEIDIPMRTIPDLVYGNAKSHHGMRFVNWRTEVKMERYSTDRFVSRLTIESLAEAISSKYNQRMKRSNATVEITLVTEDGERSTVQVISKDFEGKRLGDMELYSRDSGKTVFRMYLSKKGPKGHVGRVLLGEWANDFRIPFNMFARNLPEGIGLADKVVQALSSGLFEGEILAGKAKFHANRRGFEANDALIGLCSAIEEWFEKEGFKHYQEAKKENEGERYQELGVRSMLAIEGLLGSDSGKTMLQAISAFGYGSIGDGHVPKSGKTTSYTSVRAVNPSSTEGEGGTRDRTGSGGEEGPVEKLADTPYLVAGPQGQRRRLVKSNSLGLTLVHEPLEADKLYSLDYRTGVLTLNTRHPIWVRCNEAPDRVLMRFQEFLMVAALQTAALPEDWRPHAELAYEALTEPYSFMLVHGETLTGRQVGRKKGQKVEATKPGKSKSLVLAAKRA